MIDLDDLDLFPRADGPRPGAAKPRCRRHQTRERLVEGQLVNACERCGAVTEPEASRRGRNNRARGNAIEREVARTLGLRRVGQFGGPDDIAGLAFVGQVKSGAAFPERLWSWLRAVPRKAGQTAILVVTDAPGPGHPRRALVVLELADWRDLHGEQP